MFPILFPPKKMITRTHITNNSDELKAYGEYDYKANNVRQWLVDSYKIATSGKTDCKKFSMLNASNTPLNSDTLIGFLRTTSDDPIRHILMDVSRSTRKCLNQSDNISGLMYEDIVFFNFDPYCNFLLGNATTRDDIWQIIQSITISINRPCKILPDVSNNINPFGYEKVVFTGGGTKGIVYIGALIGLFVTGQIFYLNHYGGTSVGALMSLILSCTTPSAEDYNRIKHCTLKQISSDTATINKYREALTFIVERFTKRDIASFYPPPTYTFYGIWTALDTIIKKNGLYDHQSSGFQIWYSIICKKIAQIMGNGLDRLIIIKKSDGTYYEPPNVKLPVYPTHTNDDTYEESLKQYDQLYREYCGNLDIDKDSFDKWEIVRFFTFKEYNELTNKTLVLTGTRTQRTSVVYYTHTDTLYKNMSVITCATASMSIPWIFKAPIINSSYNLDGGLFDNYPITHCDKKSKDKIIRYDNKIFGYLLDDKNTIVDAYEVIRELWMMYDGFIGAMNIANVCESKTYNEISELFFEIRSEIYKLLYFADVDIQTFLCTGVDSEKIPEFNIIDFENILNELEAPETMDKINILYGELMTKTKGINFLVSRLKSLDTTYRCDDSIIRDVNASREIYHDFKIGKKTNLSEIIKLAYVQGNIYNELVEPILIDINNIDSKPTDDVLINRYRNALEMLMTHILGYYEIKGNLAKSDDLEDPTRYVSIIMKNMYKQLIKLEKLITDAIKEVNEHNKAKKINTGVINGMNDCIQIGYAMIIKILTKNSGNNLDLSDININQDKSSYMKAIDYFFHMDITGILYKYMSIANDRICNDSFNRMRTIKLNTFETNTLHFEMTEELKSRLIYEGFSKTIKHFTGLLRVSEITGRSRSTDPYIDSYEVRYKKMF